jgi:hypothetical protein
MKFKAICENHLYSKAYSKGKRAVTSALAVYVLPDYAAKRLAMSHPQKLVMNRIGLTTTKALGSAVIEVGVAVSFVRDCVLLWRNDSLNKAF